MTCTFEIDTLAEALPREMSRVRDEVLPAYDAIGAAEAWASGGMRRDLDRAARAMAAGDITAMLIAYKALQRWST